MSRAYSTRKKERKKKKKIQEVLDKLDHASGAVSDIEKDLEYFWNNYKVNPQYMGMSLKNLREREKNFKDLRSDVRQLVEASDKLDENTMIWFNANSCWIGEE